MERPRSFRRPFDRTLAGATGAACWLDGIASASGVGAQTLFAAEICLEEIFSNIVRHGGPPATAKAPEVAVEIEIDPEHLRLTLSDDGQPFDVSEAPAKPISEPLRDLQPGGLGILLAKSFSAKLTYRREGGLNIVVVSIPRVGDGDFVDRGASLTLQGLLDTEVFRNAVDTIEAVAFEPEDILIRQGERSETAFFLRSGSVLVYADTAYGPVTLATRHAPVLFGEIGVLAGLPRTASVKALTACVAVPIPQARMAQIGREAPDILISVIGELGKQLKSVNQTVSLYTNALAALEKREFDERILADLKNPTKELDEFSSVFRRFAEEIVHKRRQQDEMASAAIIQRSLLPDLSALALKEACFAVQAEMRPARHVGGDFYDLFLLDGDRLAISVGDVCGKGMPASLFMAVVVTVSRIAARQETDLAAMVKLVNAIIGDNNPSGMFATVIYGILELRTGRFDYCICGHHAPVVVGVDGALRSLEGGGLALGLLPDITPKVFTTPMTSGETLLFVTDGVTEAANSLNEEFGEERLFETLTRTARESSGPIVTQIISAVDAFSGGAEQFDDITCVAVQFRGPLNQSS